RRGHQLDLRTLRWRRAPRRRGHRLLERRNRPRPQRRARNRGRARRLEPNRRSLAFLARAGKRLDAWLRPRGARPLVLGHRGARHAAPENTLRAFELALAEGADGIELDVRLDGDGRVIVLHDRTLERVTAGGETRDVEALGAHELDRVSMR